MKVQPNFALVSEFKLADTPQVLQCEDFFLIAGKTGAVNCILTSPRVFAMKLIKVLLRNPASSQP